MKNLDELTLNDVADLRLRLLVSVDRRAFECYLLERLSEKEVKTIWFCTTCGTNNYEDTKMNPYLGECNGCLDYDLG